MNRIEIFQPRWRDGTVIIAKWRVGVSNQVEITARKKSGERRYPQAFKVPGEAITKCKLEDMQSPKGQFYIVPLETIKKCETIDISS